MEYAGQELSGEAWTLEREVRHLRRIVNQHSTDIAVLMDWRKNHEQAHTQADTRHAQMPGRVFTAILVGLSIVTFLLTLYFGGFGP